MRKFHRHLHAGFYLASSPVALRPPYPWPEAGDGAVASSLFCFEGDPHGLSLPFQKAERLLTEFVLFTPEIDAVDLRRPFRCTMTQKQTTPPSDDVMIRCRKLGSPVSFSYCRFENKGAPCFKIMDC